MKIYKINLYDPKTKVTTTLAEMPERRKDPSRLNHGSVRNDCLNFLNHIRGPEWVKRNKNLIGIIEHNGREVI